MQEDASRVRQGTAPQALACLHNAVISLVKSLGFVGVTQARRHFALNPLEALATVC
jgi:hypothetical protein